MPTLLFGYWAAMTPKIAPVIITMATKQREDVAKH